MGVWKKTNVSLELESFSKKTLINLGHTIQDYA